MNKFSVKILKDKLKIYKSSREEFENMISKYKLLNIKDLLCQTFLEDEITIYYIIKNNIENYTIHNMLSKLIDSDTRIYNIVNIYEDLPGIDHIGIINYISSFFVKKNIPILYINTYGHNLILISEDYMKEAMDILKVIGNVEVSEI